MKSNNVFFKVDNIEKKEIQETAKAFSLDVTNYFLFLHRNYGKPTAKQFEKKICIPQNPNELVKVVDLMIVNRLDKTSIDKYEKIKKFLFSDIQ